MFDQTNLGILGVKLAESAQYRSLLAELNKFQLIEIIIRKTIPDGLSVSEELHKCIHGSPDSEEKTISSNVQDMMRCHCFSSSRQSNQLINHWY